MGLLLKPSRICRIGGEALVVIFLCFLLLQDINTSVAAKMKVFDQPYGPFDDVPRYHEILEVMNPATINNGALQVTPDSASNDFNLKNNSGRIFLKQKFKLWENGDDDIGTGSTSSSSNGSITNSRRVMERERVTSFNSSFLVNMFPINNNTPGEGLAFLIAPDMNLPPNSFGQYLGLTNETTDGKKENYVIAVELDTFKQGFDLDDNHIGIDIHGVQSVNATSLNPRGFTLASSVARFFNIWVQYDGVNKFMEVYIAEQPTKDGPPPPRPVTPILTSDLDLRFAANQYSYFGFAASTGNTSQLNCVLRWNLTVEYFPTDKGPWLTIVLGVGLPLALLLVVGGAGLGYYFHRRRMARSQSSIRGALKSLPGIPREFEFKELKKATNDFDVKNKLGQGGFGVVYKGLLAKENSEIAVKCFLRENIKGQDEFLAELTIINRLRHKHLVRLLGWSHKNGKLLLVYEFMPKGSLDQHLFVGPEKQPLGWNLRYKIISGVASALHYLHNEYDQRVVHRDLKASNIMLDLNFNARLGDFGLARALENEKTSYAEAEGVQGTIGYIAPECFHTGKATQQSDVYAFGAVLLETVCGQRPGTKIGGFNFLVDWVWYMHRDGRLLEAIDERLGQDYNAEEAERLLLLGLACSHPIACERPKTQGIVQILSGSVAVPYVSPFKPAFVWPAMVSMDIESSLAETTSLTTSQFNTGFTDSSMV